MLRREVEALLGADEETSDFGNTTGKGPDPSSLVHREIGRYRIKHLIATGGMGAVYAAVQQQPKRTVALKLMKTGFVSAAAQRRFDAEAEILGRLRHPGIARRRSLPRPLDLH